MTMTDERAIRAAAQLENDQHGSLLGFAWSYLRRGEIGGRFEVQKHHLAPTGFLHAASVVALADTACGYGCLNALPDGATAFTTAELKANFLGTARDGFVSCAGAQR